MHRFLVETLLWTHWNGRKLNNIKRTVANSRPTNHNVLLFATLLYFCFLKQVTKVPETKYRLKKSYKISNSVESELSSMHRFLVQTLHWTHQNGPLSFNKYQIISVCFLKQTAKIPVTKYRLKETYYKISNETENRCQK